MVKVSPSRKVGVRKIRFKTDTKDSRGGEVALRAKKLSALLNTILKK